MVRSNVRTAEVDICIYCSFLCLNLALRTLTDASHDEWKLFSGLKPTFYTSSLVNMEEDIRNGPYSVFLANLQSSSEEGEVVGEVGQWGYQTPQAQEAFNNQTLKTTVALQAGIRSILYLDNTFLLRFQENI